MGTFVRKRLRTQISNSSDINKGELFFSPHALRLHTIHVKPFRRTEHADEVPHLLLFTDKTHTRIHSIRTAKMTFRQPPWAGPGKRVCCPPPCRTVKRSHKLLHWRPKIKLRCTRDEKSIIINARCKILHIIVLCKRVALCSRFTIVILWRGKEEKTFPFSRVPRQKKCIIKASRCVAALVVRDVRTDTACRFCTS